MNIGFIGPKIETPFGSKVGKIWEKFEILGISSYLTQTLNMPNDPLDRDEIVDIDVPPGTLAIVPMPNFWFLAHGQLTPDKIDPLDENQHITWNSADRPWGLGWVQVSVVDVNEPDYSVNPPTQTAQLRIVMRLCDYNADDRWFGATGYSLIFLGRTDQGTGRSATTVGATTTTRSRQFKLERKRIG